MAMSRFTALAILMGLALAACGKSYSTQNVGYRGYTSGSAAPATGGKISPPSSGTSNGTGEAASSATHQLNAPVVWRMMVR